MIKSKETGPGDLMNSYKIVNYGDDIKLIGVVSDSHIPSRGRHLPPQLFNLFEKVQLILHAGDLVEEYIIDELKAIAPVEAVAGNMDPVQLDKKLGRFKLLCIGQELKIGLLHGDISGRRLDYEHALKLFEPHHPGAVVFGHLHMPVDEKYQGILFFNPGSLIDPRRPGIPSCGLLRISGSNIDSEILYLE